MALDISATSPRVQYTVGSSSTTTFAYGFPIFQDADLKVFVGSTLKTLTTHYTVTGAGTTSGGNVVMTTGNEVTNADVTIVRDITISRTTDFPTSGSFQVDSLNTELDTITAVQQELEDDISRSLKLSDEDATATLTLPLKDARKGRYLAFNTTTGNAEAGPTQTDATAIASVTSDIATLADIQDGTTATNAITTVATASGNIQTVATANSAINTIATGTTGGNSNLTNLNTIATGTTGGNANLTQINAVASDLTDINTVASKATEIGRLGTTDAVADMALLGDSAIITDMGLLAVDTVIADMALLAEPAVITDMDLLGASGVIGNIASVAGKTTEIGALGTNANITNMTALNGTNVITHMANLNGTNVISNMSNLNGTGVLTNIANLNGTGVLTNIANLNASGVIANIGTVANKDTEIGQLAPKATDISTVAGKITDVEAVAHLEDGTTATSAVSTLSARSSDMQTLSPRASDLQSLGPKATEIGRIGASSGNITSLTTLGTTTAVADMNTLAPISSDISSLAGALEKTYTVTVTNVGGQNLFNLDGSYNNISVFRGNTYIFNQNASSNNGHPLGFINGSSDYDVGVTYKIDGSVVTKSQYSNTTTFNAGTTRSVQLEVATSAPSSGLAIKCLVHGTAMGLNISVTDSNISLVANGMTNINITATNIGAVNNVSTEMTKVTNVHNNMSDVNALNGTDVLTNIATLATGQTSGISNLSSIALINTGSNMANITTVSTNINSVNDFAEKYRIGSSDPSSSLNTGDLFYNTSSNTLKIYTGSAWEAGVTAGSGFAPLTGANFTGDVSFPDNVLAKFGASNDLQISHNGTNSVIKDAGTGNLSLQSNGTNINFWDTSNSQLMGHFDIGGGVNLYHNGSKKYETTSSGINILGNAKADSLSIDHASNDWNFELSGADLVIKNGSTTLFKLDTSGNLTVAGDITTDGSL
tara:strand:+ start:13531 stop:16362 length:2832 start_codon:yes stop_codon:yes gene_type:complete